jgi:hypothetical protein
MFVVTVEFTVHPHHVEAFRARMVENARTFPNGRAPATRGSAARTR